LSVCQSACHPVEYATLLVNLNCKSHLFLLHVELLNNDTDE